MKNFLNDMSTNLISWCDKYDKPIRLAVLLAEKVVVVYLALHFPFVG
jgi:hypothetical protein